MSDIFILTLGCIGLVVLTVASVVWDRQDRVDTTAPEHITQVCMDCGEHIRGPNPPLSPRLVSHGLCPECAEIWKEVECRRFLCRE